MLKKHKITLLDNGIAIQYPERQEPYVGYAHDTEHYHDMTEKLGYNRSNIVLQAQEHDILHVAVCQLLGMDTSYVLSKITDEYHYGTESPDLELGRLEEEAVYALQRLANAHKISILKLAQDK